MRKETTKDPVFNFPHWELAIGAVRANPLFKPLVEIVRQQSDRFFGDGNIDRLDMHEEATQALARIIAADVAANPPQPDGVWEDKLTGQTIVGLAEDEVWAQRRHGRR